MKVLVACEFSGIVRDAFAARGHDVMSCDLLPTERPGNHYQGDVRDVLSEYWDLIIAHPECTYITNAGVRWLDRDIDRWKKMWDACQFFRMFLEHPCPRIVVENPIPHKYAAAWIGQRHSQLIQPNQFGGPFRKATCLWLKGVQKLTGAELIPRDQCRQECWLESPGPERKKNRSRTYPGIAAAMAEQWGSPV